MRRGFFCIMCLIFCVAAVGVLAQSRGEYPSIGEVIRVDERLDELLAPDANIEVLASGFAWAEGPLWIEDEDGGSLLFSDIPNNSVMRWREAEGISVYMNPAGYTGVADYGREPGSNGLTLDREGRIVFCEHGDRRISRLTPGGGKMTVADRFDGKRFNSPNDAVVKSNGDVYFTDPIYGLPKQADDPMRELDFCGVFRWSAADEGVTLLTSEFSRPNGIAFSPDESKLYVAQSDPERPIVMVFEVAADGSLGEGEVLHDFSATVEKLPGLPDGLKVDRRGNLFVTGPGGVTVLTPDGEVLGRIATGRRTSNCAWGNDGSVLYMTADDLICRIQTRTKGANFR